MLIKNLIMSPRLPGSGARNERLVNRLSEEAHVVTNAEYVNVINEI